MYTVAHIVKIVAYRYTADSYKTVSLRYNFGEFCQFVWQVDKTEQVLV